MFFSWDAFFGAIRVGLAGVFLVMPVLILQKPFALDTTTHPVRVADTRATRLDFADMATRVGRVIRGRGWARTDDVSGDAYDVIACAGVGRRDCRLSVLAQNTNGTLYAHNAPGIGSAGRSCSGPIPAWNDPQVADGATISWVAADNDPNLTGGTTIFALAVSGRTYRIEAYGVWGQDPSAAYRCGPSGSTVLTGPISGGVFAGNVAWGQFWIKNPAGTWVYNGPAKEHLATASGTFFGAFGDENGLYGDNVGNMMVAVWEV